jgi:protein SCO1
VAFLQTLLASLALLLAGGGALGAATYGFQAFTTESARRVSVRRNPVDVPRVALQTQSGASIDFSSLGGKWLLVDFIYTRCPSYCQASGSESAQLQDRLAEPIAQGRVELLSISIDPDRDTPPRLAAYLERSRDRGRGWLAARPLGRDGLQRLERAFGITVVADGFGGYTHNAAFHLVDPRGRLVEIFDVGNPQAVRQAVMQRLLR